MTTPPVLLFAHGAGFCKEIWSPIIRRLQQSSLLAGVDFVSVDLPFHGSNHDNSVAAQVDEKGPHVTHPANNAIAMASTALQQKAQTLITASRPVIGIGHSMGAAALWKAEVSSPGTFKALVLFEPIYGPPLKKGPDRPYNFMADVTLKRQWKWCGDCTKVMLGGGCANCAGCSRPSRVEATTFFESWKSFSSWDRESLASWMEGAIVPDEHESNAVVLACHPTVEAAIYCGGRLWLSPEEQTKTRCPTTFHTGSTTKLFRQEVFEKISAHHPKIFKVHDPMVGRSHLLVLEDPEACARAILSDLESLDCFSAVARL
ncbi:unnamed protein product [Phytophthora fragariaefolia]|uniref:Unnamed protein product n=1 Tax=Phytophthora fragariaefolia TaxID=1490495 RepID=A0A9W6XMZ4_9STRA|nr:unnamed protein product [Phytophthora fragariaefolia]